MRVGIGSTALAFDPSRILMLGGVKVAGLWGLRGAGDGDVLLRALVDALLGAAGLGDRDDHFPREDARWADAPAATLVAECSVKLAARGLVVGNVDATLHSEREELRLQRASMAERMAALLGLEGEQVNVKLAPGGSLGADGIGALVIVSLREQDA